MNRTLLLTGALALMAIGAAAITVAQDEGAVLTNPSWGPETQVLYRSGDTARLISGDLISATEDWVQLGSEDFHTWIDRDDVIYLRQAP